MLTVQLRLMSIQFVNRQRILIVFNGLSLGQLRDHILLFKILGIPSKMFFLLWIRERVFYSEYLFDCPDLTTFSVLIGEMRCANTSYDGDLRDKVAQYFVLKDLKLERVAIQRLTLLFKAYIAFIQEYC